MDKVLFSSSSCEWSTPQDLFDSLNLEFNFTLDPCSTHENAKCAKHFTLKENGLDQDWGGETVFCNPPYGKELSKWIKKSYYESFKPNTVVVMLIPARTDTIAFHDYILGHSEIRFLRGRLKFGCSNNSAPFPSMIVIFNHFFH